MIPRCIENAMREARFRSRALGYDIGDFELSGAPTSEDRLWVARCRRTLCLAFVHADTLLSGTAVTVPSGSDDVDKTIPFTPSELTPEFRALINRHWKSP